MSSLITLSDVRKMDAQQRAELKRTLQTGPYYLADRILRRPTQKPLVPNCHLRILETMPTPNPDLAIEDWSPLKTSVILAPRGSLKSTLISAWCVSAILSYPDIEILIVSGEGSLSESLSRKIQLSLRHEVIAFLFPEVQPVKSKSSKQPKKVNADEYFCPARSTDNLSRDATVQSSSLGAAKAGAHCHVLIYEDCANEKNQASEESALRVISQHEDCAPILTPNCYEIFSGTRWQDDDELDLSQVIVDNCERDFKLTGERTLNLTVLPVWTLRTDGTPAEVAERLERERKHLLRPTDVNWLWSALQSPKLMRLYRESYRTFACQYLMQPNLAAVKKVIFGKELLDSQIVDSYHLPPPHLSEVLVNCDLAGVASEQGDDACAQVYLRDFTTGRLFLIDGFCRPFTSSTELSFALVDLIRNYNPKLVRIENSLGSRLLEGELLAIAEKLSLMNLQEKLAWSVPENTTDAKRKRIFALAGAMRVNKVQVYSGYRDLEILRTQLNKFTSVSKIKGKDDAADCLAAALQWTEDMEVVEATPEMLKAPPPPDFDPIPLPRVQDERQPDRSAEENERSCAKFQESLLYPYGRGK
jgi:hypothetical protein